MTLLRLPILLATLSIPAVARGRLAADPKPRSEKFLNTADEFVKPFMFDQRLLICNAYPGTSRAMVDKNHHEPFADADHGIAFRECRYIAGHVQRGDKLHVKLNDVGGHGTFEVGELPASDAVLLLVFEKRSDGGSEASFQSYAFPTGRNSNEAQLAIIDAFRGNASTASFVPYLRMEDHIEGEEKQKDARRTEQLNFNRVYAIEEGLYEASVADRVANATASAGEVVAEAARQARRVIKLAKNQNYVILRTGDARMGEAQSLVVFPDVEFKSAASRSCASLLGFATTIYSLTACLQAAA